MFALVSFHREREFFFTEEKTIDDVERKKNTAIDVVSKLVSRLPLGTVFSFSFSSSGGRVQNIGLLALKER